VGFMPQLILDPHFAGTPAVEPDDPPDSCLANCKIDGTARAERALANTESGRYLSEGFLEVEEPGRTSWSLRKRGRLTTKNEAASKGPPLIFLPARLIEGIESLKVEDCRDLA
jgi:hypothetical protein